MSAPHWLGPYKDASTALNELRKSVAEIIGADPETWPDHGNAPLAIAATLAIAMRTQPAPAQPVAVPAGIEAAADFLAKAAFGTCYASLRGDGSIRERGFEPVVYSTWGGQIFQGTKRDMDDLAREVVRLAAPVSPPVEAQREALKCFICREPILKGQMVLPDYTEGLGHRECFGSDRDGFCNLETGEPLGPDEPLPPGEPYEPDAAPVTPPAKSGAVKRLRAGWMLMNDNGKRWRICGPAGRWVMKPEGAITSDEARTICETAMGTALASTPAPQQSGAARGLHAGRLSVQVGGDRENKYWWVRVYPFFSEAAAHRMRGPILSALSPSPSGWDAGAEAMREECAAHIDAHVACGSWCTGAELRALPLPTPPTGGKAEKTMVGPPADASTIRWAVERWQAEVMHRPLVNVHRRSLDDCWRQVIRHFGGDPEALVGPAHDELVSALPSPKGNELLDPSPTHRHLKRGSEYRVIGEAEAQVSTGDYRPDWTIERRIADGDRLTVYQGTDGKLWARFSDEFNDGRFESLPTPQAGEG